MIRAVIFDLDMCIFDTHSLGENILDPVLEPLQKLCLTEEVRTEIARVLWTTSLEDTIELFGIPNEVAESMRTAHQELSIPENMKTFGDEAYIKELLVHRVLVTSGYHKWQAGKIEKLGIAPLFHEVIIDAIDDRSARKGKKEIFRDIMVRHNLVPSEICVVGDNPLSELRAGKELGMLTVQTLRPTVKRTEEADHHIYHFAELRELVC